MKKLLYITSLSGRRINGFMRSSILAANAAGIEYHIASNEENADRELWERDCLEYGIYHHHVPFQRNPLSRRNFVAKACLSELMEELQPDAVHCNTPVGGLLGRICARKKGIHPVIYQAHGFHFYKGAPLKNWALYYPIEWLLARQTDLLITINREDYALAKKHMHAKRVEYVPGVGIDLSKFSIYDDSSTEREHKCTELGVPIDAKLLLSVGELNRNKNHETVIRALSIIGDYKIHYCIAGAGELRDELKQLAVENGLQDRVHFLGYRNDISVLCRAVDLFVFPSIREDLPVALMEAIACKRPVLCSKIRGNSDLVENPKYLFDPCDSQEVAEKLEMALRSDNREVVIENFERLKSFDLKNATEEIKALYRSHEIFGGGGNKYQNPQLYGAWDSSACEAAA